MSPGNARLWRPFHVHDVAGTVGHLSFARTAPQSKRSLAFFVSQLGFVMNERTFNIQHDTRQRNWLAAAVTDHSAIALNGFFDHNFPLSMYAYEPLILPACSQEVYPSG